MNNNNITGVSLGNTSNGLVAVAMSISGIKSSQKLVDDASTALEHCLNNDWLTNGDLGEIMQACKKASIESEAKARSVFKQGSDARNAKTSNQDLLKQYLQSVPEQKRTKFLDTVVKFVTQMQRAISITKGDPRCMAWGTIVRTRPMTPVVLALRDDCSSYLIPQGKWALQGAFMYNGITFDQALSIIEPHLTYTVKFMKEVANKGGFSWVAPGQPIPGTSALSTNGQWQLNDTGKGLIGKVDEDAPWRVIRGIPLTQYMNSTPDRPAPSYLAGAVVIDIRLALQTSDYKQFRSGKQKAVVAGWMNDMIILTGEKGWTGTADLNSKSDFTQAYYLALGKIRATIRAANATVYGRKGGADTRSGKSFTELPTESRLNGFQMQKK